MNKKIGKQTKNLKEKIFGRLTVIKYVGLDKRSNAIWLVKCSCGTSQPFDVVGYRLTNGRCKSCGCLQKELFSKRSKSQRKYPIKMKRLYKIWSGMKQRCFNKKCNAFKDYGKIGITVCDKWKNNFENFMNWSISNGYNDSLTIERISVFGNYEPKNCRWATIAEQQNNKRNTLYIEINGEIKSLMEWSILSGFSYQKLYDRLRNGWKSKDLFLDKKPIYENKK